MILLDVMMPGIDGWDIFGELLEDERTATIPVVFLTARAELRDQARGLELGGVDYVTKPFDPLELAPLIDDLLARVERGDVQERRRERLAELRAATRHRLNVSYGQPSEVGRDEAVRTAGHADPDATEAAVEQVLAVRRARIHMRTIAAAEQRLRPGGEVLPEVGRPHAEAAEPRRKRAVVEVAASGHVARVRLRCTAQGRADDESRHAVPLTKRVDQPDDRELARAERRTARRQRGQRHTGVGVCPGTNTERYPEQEHHDAETAAVPRHQEVGATLMGEDDIVQVYNCNFR